MKLNFPEICGTSARLFIHAERGIFIYGTVIEQKQLAAIPAVLREQMLKFRISLLLSGISDNSAGGAFHVSLNEIQKTLFIPAGVNAQRKIGMRGFFRNAENEIGDQ